MQRCAWSVRVVALDRAFCGAWREGSAGHGIHSKSGRYVPCVIQLTVMLALYRTASQQAYAFARRPWEPRGRGLRIDLNLENKTYEGGCRGYR
jgi:hypothetical protein